MLAQRSARALWLALPALLLLAGCGSDSPAPSSPALFVVSEARTVHGDSYLLPLTAEEDIATARAMIREPQARRPRIVVARIAPGAGDYGNRDVLNGDRAWSWHVSEFLGFADTTIEILDGWPGYVEENLEDWLRLTHGTIGFWSYTVTAELGWGG